MKAKGDGGATDTVWDSAAVLVGPEFDAAYRERLERDGALARRIVFSQTRSAFMTKDPIYESITYFALTRAHEESKKK